MAVANLVKRIELPRGSRFIVRQNYPLTRVTPPNLLLRRMKMSDLLGLSDEHGRF